MYAEQSQRNNTVSLCEKLINIRTLLEPNSLLTTIVLTETITKPLNTEFQFETGGCSALHRGEHYDWMFDVSQGLLVMAEYVCGVTFYLPDLE